MSDDYVFNPGDFEIDFGAVADELLIPDGEYLATVKAATPGQSKSGYPKIDLQWQIAAGSEEGRVVFETMSFHPKAKFRVVRVLKALGFESGFAGAINPESLVGRSANLLITTAASSGIDPVTQEPYPPRNQIGKIWAASDADLMAAL